MLNRFFNGDNGVVPVVMFHSVGAENHDWVFNYISEPYAAFESKIKHLKKGGFNFITWADLYEYMQGNKELPQPSILLTFDDGYLDNWVNIYPILKKYNAKGTIFMSTDFVDPSSECRFTTEDVVNGKCKAEDLTISGFLNWAEMREMEASGVVDIQSHAASHTWYFKNDVVRDFWGPDAKQYPWMAWNEKIDDKPFYMRDNQYSLVKPGTPVYEYEKSLVVTQCFPPDEVTIEMTSFVEGNGGELFFECADWKQQLLFKHEELIDKYHSNFRYESTDERKARMYDELSASKIALEENLRKTVDFICWPGGGYDEMTLEVAREVGYKSWTLGSQDMSDFRNVSCIGPQHIKRIGSAINQSWRGQDLGYTNGIEFYYGVKRHQGSVYHKWVGRILRLYRIIASKI